MLRSRGWSYCLFWKQGYVWELRQEWPEEQPMALPPAVLLAAWASSLQVHGHTLVTCCGCKRCQDSPGCLEILLSLLPQPCFMSVSRVGPEHQWYLENTLGESCHRGCLSLSHKEPAPTPPLQNGEWSAEQGMSSDNRGQVVNTKVSREDEFRECCFNIALLQACQTRMP